VPLNGWHAYAHQYGTPKFEIIDGICIVEGLIKSGAWSILATLPADCRPNKRLIFNLNNHQFTSHVDVLENGQVGWVAGGRSHHWISLSGIAFPTLAPRSNLALAKGWVAYGHCYKTPSFTVVKGMCFVEGTIKSGAWNHLATLPDNCRPPKRLIFNLNNHQYTSRVDVTTDGKIHWVAGGRRHGWLSLTGIMFATKSAESQALTLASKWAAYGHDYGAPSVAVVDGMCNVEGLIRSGAWGFLATLPTNCHPNKRLIFNMNNNQFTSRIDVLTNGQIHWVAGGRSHGWISLSGITFARQLPA